MITGDHKLTVSGNCKELDISGDGDLAMTGVGTGRHKPGRLKQKVDQYSVFARVSPETQDAYC